MYLSCRIVAVSMTCRHLSCTNVPGTYVVQMSTERINHLAAEPLSSVMPIKSKRADRLLT